MSRAAVVLHLEGEAGVARAVGSRRELQLAPVMSATGMVWPAVTALPPRSACRWSGSVVIWTARKPLAGLSLGSLKPKLAEREGVGSCLPACVTVLSAPAGAWLGAAERT